MDAASAGACSGKSKSGKVRQLRWSSASMSRRLEEIVYELTQPLRDHKQNFLFDLSLLEEYLTEAAAQQLDGNHKYLVTVSELMIQSSMIYGRKVDFYEQSVNDMVKRCRAATSRSHNEGDGEEQAQAGAESAETPTSRRRKRRHSDAVPDFAPIDLEPAPNIDMEINNVKPPPMLPKTYIEFERAPIMESDARLSDYHGNEIGVIGDFHVNWNLKDGLLVDDLDSSAAVSREMVRPVIMVIQDEHQRKSPLTSGSDSGIECSAIEHHEDADETLLPSTEITQVDLTKPKEGFSQKRKANAPANQLCSKKRKSHIELKRRKALEKWWREVRRLNGDQCSFEGDFVLDICDDKLLVALRGQLYRNLLTRGLRMLAIDSRKDFLGFSHGSAKDCTGGMQGFSMEEVRSARAAREAWVVRAPTEWRLENASAWLSGHRDSDDDGFYDGSPDAGAAAGPSRALPLPVCAQPKADYLELSNRVEEWHALVAPRVAAAQRNAAYDVHAYSGALLQRLPPARAEPVSQLLEGLQPHDVSRYFLATLFLANTGNVEIVQSSEPLSINSFDVRLLTTDPALYASVDPMLQGAPAGTA